MRNITGKFVILSCMGEVFSLSGYPFYYSPSFDIHLYILICYFNIIATKKRKKLTMEDISLSLFHIGGTTTQAW